MDIIYHSMPTTWKNKMIEEGFNDADFTVKEMTLLFENSVENWKPKEEKKKLLWLLVVFFSLNKDIVCKNQNYLTIDDKIIA